MQLWGLIKDQSPLIGKHSKHVFFHSSDVPDAAEFIIISSVIITLLVTGVSFSKRPPGDFQSLLAKVKMQA